MKKEPLSNIEESDRESLNSIANHGISRRTFVRNAVGFMASLSLSNSFGSKLFSEERADITIVEGKDPALQTRAALQGLGGIEHFVHRGDRVVLLPNSVWRYPGAVVNPLIGLEVARLCTEAGARSVRITTHVGMGRWGADIGKELEALGCQIKSPIHPKDYITLSVPNARVRKEVTILRDAIEHDVLINIPVFKNHYGARISGCIKNLMGANWDSISFHQGEAYLQQAIADLASVILPHLCIVDVTTILMENGPGGPGRTIKPNQVIAGRDMVALDALCCPLLGLKPNEVGHIRFLDDSGRGQIDLSKKQIKRMAL